MGPLRALRRSCGTYRCILRSVRLLLGLWVYPRVDLGETAGHEGGLLGMSHKAARRYRAGKGFRRFVRNLRGGLDDRGGAMSPIGRLESPVRRSPWTVGPCQLDA